jgi:hypothetical protein
MQTVITGGTSNFTGSTGIASIWVENRFTGSGTLAAVYGIYSTGLFLNNSVENTIAAVNGMTVAGITNTTGTPSGTVALVRGITINNSGKGTGTFTITDLIGVDITSQTVGSNTSIGLRIATPSGATNNYALQLSGTGGTASSGITFGTDVTLYRSAANVLKTDDKLLITLDAEIDGALDHDGLTVGFYGVTPTTRPTTLTAANAIATDGTVATNDTITNNLRTRINELETKLQALGLLS